jgi:hypothetical protein
MTEIEEFIQTYALQLRGAIDKMINDIEKLVDIGESFVNNHELSRADRGSVHIMQADIFKYHIWEILACVPDFARKNLIDEILKGIAKDEREKNRSVH